MTKGHFLDTGILLDAIYLGRPNHKRYETWKRKSDFGCKLQIGSMVVDEALQLAEEATQWIILPLRNRIKNEDWDNLEREDKIRILDEVLEEIRKDEDIADRKREFVLNLYELSKVVIQWAKKEAIYSDEESELFNALFRDLQGNYTAKVRELVAVAFGTPTFADTINDERYQKYNKELFTINVKADVFKQKESYDFKILSEIMSILEFGAKYDAERSEPVDSIAFYHKDNKFKKNFEKLKEHLNKANIPEELSPSLKQNINAITFTFPYISRIGEPVI